MIPTKFLLYILFQASLLLRIRNSLGLNNEIGMNKATTQRDRVKRTELVSSEQRE